MDTTVLITCLLIILARIVDVSLDTFRVIAIVRGKRLLAFSLGFFEVLIWVSVVSRVVQKFDEPIILVAYATGFAFGNFLGVTIEGWIGAGEQVLRIFTKHGQEVARALRGLGFQVTKFLGEGKDGPVSLLFIETTRRNSREVLNTATQLDSACFYVIDDIRLSSSLNPPSQRQHLWSLLVKRGHKQTS